MAERIQLRRTAGWRLREVSPDAIVVDRRTKWGNPFKVGMVVNRIAYLEPRAVFLTITEVRVKDVDNAVEYYRRWLDGTALLVGGHDLAPTPPTVEEIRAHLGGHDLACWCPLIKMHGQRVPCHADVLLELANA